MHKFNALRMIILTLRGRYSSEGSFACNVFNSFRNIKILQYGRIEVYKSLFQGCSMNFENLPVTVCGPFNRRHTQGVHGKALLAQQPLRWVQWGPVFRARGKRGPERQLSLKGPLAVPERRRLIGRSAPSSVSTLRILSGSSVSTSLSGSILCKKYPNWSFTLNFCFVARYEIWSYSRRKSLKIIYLKTKSMFRNGIINDYFLEKKNKKLMCFVISLISRNFISIFSFSEYDMR